MKSRTTTTRRQTSDVFNEKKQEQQQQQFVVVVIRVLFTPVYSDASRRGRRRHIHHFTHRLRGVVYSRFAEVSRDDARLRLADVVFDIFSDVD